MNWKNTAIVALISLVASVVGGMLVLLSAPKVQVLGAEGDTNLTNLVLSGTLSATGAATLSGGATITGTISIGTSTIGNAVVNRGALTISTLATTTTATVTAAQFCGYGVINISAGTNTTSTITLPHATSTAADCLSVDGSQRSVLFINTSSSANTVTFASSTGMTFQKPFNVSSTFTIPGTETAIVTYFRDTSTTVKVHFDRFFGQ